MISSIHGQIQKWTNHLLGTPQLVDLFNNISLYVSELRSSSASEHVAKKRKLDDSNGNGDVHANGSMNGGSKSEAVDNEEALLAVQDISVVIPQRKKYTIEFTHTRIRARDPKTNELVPGAACKWADIGMPLSITSMAL